MVLKQLQFDDYIEAIKNDTDNKYIYTLKIILQC
jgi:hypothetical protein